MELDAYLARIGLKGPPDIDFSGLATVVRAQVLAIPFENLDIALGRPVSLERAPLFDKLVLRRRGGWCFELNGLLGWALGALGFRVTRIAAAAGRRERGPAVIGNHLALLVELADTPYLVDGGFGQGPAVPVPLQDGRFAVGGLSYALRRRKGGVWRLSVLGDGQETSYDFKGQAADEALVGRQCQMLQSAARSPFVQNVVAMRQRAAGMASLRGRVLRQSGGEGLRERLITDADDLVTTLNSQFGLDLPEAAGLWPRILRRHEMLFAAGDA